MMNAGTSLFQSESASTGNKLFKFIDMKSINRKISLLISRLCAVCISVLGFSCSSPDEPDNTLCMYGMPTGDFEIKGSVKTEDGKPIQQAEVRVTYPEADSGLYSFCSTQTDKKGEYKIQERGWSPELNLKVVCIPKDSALEADSIIVKMDYKQDGIHYDKDAWMYVGFADATVNFNLKRKAQSE